MRTEPEPRTRLVDVSRLAADAGPVLAWYEWYADPNRRPLEPDDIARLVDALGPLEPYSELDGPVGDATCVLLAGGLGYSTADHLDALDTLDRLVGSDSGTPRKWHNNPRPLTFVALPLQLPDEQPSVFRESPIEPERLQLPGVSWPLPSRIP